ncbi:hypothetical protein COCSADRAFT_155264 [Bipolaris sorokiniana ND90Pr]|uniref:Uncharacterized protein n=1 Tax=Cochliobolus sativus (strain ND90Pr / ATCC 201652) TaxID=665912 RepID=M2TK12_COCSN|nr:uncharacterized protein COCSADRAFT_155264 [Bipolaris sorokiniana ND90Pr]EMD69032.1 hypothetical protein COCSADRAFT_155264 [Bipolaris sorokiniana ND90Pr]
MPLRCPAGALPEAYRLICLRSVRAFARGQKEKCSPVPEYVEAEFAVFLAAMDLVAAARHGDEPEDDWYAAKQRLESAALDLAR